MLASKLEFEFHQKQSKHNFRLAQNLFETQDGGEAFLDWVITCSFYSALHFVTAELMFRKHVRIYQNTIEFNGIEKISQGLRKRSFAKLPTETVQGRHETLKRLVKDNFDHKIQAAYNKLFDEAKVSRYKFFPWNDIPRAQLALSNVKLIEGWYNSLHP